MRIINVTTALSIAFVMICCAAGVAQPPSDPSPTPADAYLADALDAALVQIRRAEARGADSREAYQLAWEIVASVLQRDSFHRRAKYYRGRLLILANRGPEALGAVQEWTETPQGENDWEAHFLLGALYNAGGYHKLVQAKLAKAASLNPSEPRIYTELARCHLALGSTAEAVRYARQAANLVGEQLTPSYHALLAETLLADGQLAEAEQHIQQALGEASATLDSSAVSRNQLSLLSELYALGMRIVEKAVQLDPTRVQLYQDAARITRQRAKIDNQVKSLDALDWYLRGVANASGPPPTALYHEAIRLCVQLRRLDQARALTERFLTHHPADPLAVEWGNQLLSTESTPESNVDAPLDSDTADPDD